MITSLNRYHLICLDIDGTIAKRDEMILYDDVVPTLADYTGHLALTTNQGGPACRDAGWKNSKRYPTMADVSTRCQHLADLLEAHLYIAFAYVTRSGKVLLPNRLDPNSGSAQRSWRKPAPGMIHQASKDCGVAGEAVLMVGDRPEDQAAAQNAEVSFMWADTFFGRESK